MIEPKDPITHLSFVRHFQLPPSPPCMRSSVPEQCEDPQKGLRFFMDDGRYRSHCSHPVAHAPKKTCFHGQASIISVIEPEIMFSNVAVLDREAKPFSANATELLITRQISP